MGQVRIESPGGMGNSTKVYSQDGVDITHGIRKIDINLEAGKINTAVIEYIVTESDVVAEVEKLFGDVVVEKLAEILAAAVLTPDFLTGTLETQQAIINVLAEELLGIPLPSPSLSAEEAGEDGEE